MIKVDTSGYARYDVKRKAMLRQMNKTVSGRGFMKKFLYLCLTGLFLFLAGCSSSSPVAMSAEAQNADELSSSSAVIAKYGLSDLYEQQIYTNTQLHFSFAIPREWNSDNYTILIDHPVLSTLNLQEKSKSREDALHAEINATYTKIDFIFRNDLENPLLRILAVPSTYWQRLLPEKNQESPLFPTFLVQRDDIVFSYILPTGCPYSDSATADLYNSMVMEQEEVEDAFRPFW